MMKRVLTLLLCVVMVFTMLPITMASAASNNQQQIEAEGGSKTIDNGNITLSKTVSPTEKENYFDVTLTVTDREIIEESATEVVIVLDISNTMTDPHSGNPGSTRFADARAAAANFTTQYFTAPNLGSVRKLGLVTFNTHAKSVIGLQQVSRNVVNQIRGMTVENLTGLSESAYDASHDRFTNIEGGLKMAKAMLDKGDPDAHKFIILLTDGFPTTYVQSTNKDGSLKGYDPYDSAGTRFKDYQWNRPCTYGTSYSDTAAKKAQTAAAAIRNAGVNIVSIGIDVNSTAQTIQGYLNKCKNAAYSTVERPKGAHPDNYVIGSANDHKDYRRWLGDSWTAGSTAKTGIGGGPDLAKAYYTGDSLTELNTAFNNILDIVTITSARSMNDPLVLDPMGEHVDFLGFYNKNGQFVTTNLDGSHAENSENTASFSSAINWRLDESGYTVTTKAENGQQIAYHTYTLKYRIRLENELADFVEAEDYFTNDNAVLKYTPPDEDPSDNTPPKEKEEKFPDPKVEGYLASFSFTKTNEDGTAKLSGAEFTLTHDGKNCAVCGGDATIHNQVATSEPNGIVSFTRIPSGHTYTLKETKSPVGYQPNSTVYTVVVAYDTVTVDGAADFSSVPNTAVIPTTWKLSGSKTADAGIALNGHTFRITDLDRNSVDVLSDSEGKFSFSKTFSGAGTYGFEIREVAGNNDMVVYDDTIYYVQVTVALNSAGTAYEVVGQTIRKSTGETADSITFHNAKRAPTSVELVATKVLDGRMLAADDFTFVLKDASNATLQTKTNTAALTDNVVFDELSFDTPGTYTYTISEVKGSENYMVYDETIWNVTVEVTAPAGSDSLSASVSYSYLKDSSSVNADKIVFTNKLVDSGYADFRFTKTDKDGKALSGASFTLTHIDCGCGATIDVQTATSDASGVVSFTQIPSGHNYRLDEVVDADGDVTIDGIDYQPAYYRDVVVSFGKVYVDGELIEDANDLTIVNIPLEAARVVLEGIKTIDGVHNALYDGKFTFTLTEVDANGENGTLIDSQTNMTSASEQNAAASKVIFKPLFYYTEGTHYYIVSESAQNLPGVVLDTTDYYVKVVVDSTGTKLNATVYVSTVSFADAVEVTTDGYGSFHGINFNNLLRTPTSASFQAKKVITSGTDALEAGDFTFVLKDANGNILEEVANAADGSVTFSAINYDTANTYHYTISEKVHSGDSVIYDTKVVDVQVAVTEDSGTSYTVAVTYDGSNEIPTFSNAYKGQLIVVKQDEAGSPVAGAEFTLTHSAECLCGTTVDAMTGTSRDDGHVMITNIPSGHTYILSETGVPTGYSPAPDHIVTVEKGVVKVYDLGASSPSTQEHHVIVNYPAVVISGDKQLVGRDLESGEFSFVLKDSNGNSIETVTNDSEGYFTFAPLTLTQEDAGKTLVYTVEEVEGTLPGVTYSTVLYKVTVQLDAHMKATVTYDQQENTSAEAENGISTQDITGGILFTNVYTPTPVEVVFGGEKTLSGRDLRAEDFHFELYPTDSDYDVPQSELPLQTAFNAADGTYSFKPVTFRGVGTFHYVVKELNNLLGGVTYDDTVYQIEVTVTDDTASGKLVASVKVNGEPADPAQLDFSNSYKITGNTEVVLSGVKALTGKAITKGAFTFELVDSNGTVVQTAENHADGTFSFEKLTFDKIDTYTYTVREKAGTETGMVYDSTVYNVSIQVLDNMAGGLRNEVSITDKDGNPVEQIQFHNEYHKPGELVLGGTKTVDGLTPGENYTFKLIRMSDGKEIDRVTSAADGSFFFDPITFSSEGTYLYEVVEQKGSDANMIYDSTVYHISVTVTKVGNEYQAVATIRNHATGAVVSGITFNNTHRDPATVYLTAEKALKGRELVDGEFAFELYNITDPDNVILVQRVENDDDGDITFSGLQFNAKGTYRYRLVEVGTTVVSSTEPYMIYDKTVYEVEIVVNDPADLDSRDPFVIESVTYFKDGKACTAQELVFSNELKDPGTADFSFTKVNDQDAPMKDVAFTLTHADCDCGVEIPTMEAVSDANGIVTFKNIPSGHYYILSEKNEITVNGITYKKIVDRYVAVHYNTVYVDGVKAEQPGDVVIVNMPKTSARVTLEGIKTLAGHEVPDNVFTFDLVEYENVDGVFKEKEGGLKLVEHNVTMANTENVVASRIVFDPIGYNSTGTWYYKITERAEVSSTHPNDYIFDATAYYVTVVVADSGNDGNLQATVSMTTDAFGSKQTVGTASGNSTGSVQVTGLDFANSLRKSAEVVLQATKTIEGSHEDLEQFYFILKDEDGNVLETVTNNKNGNIQFSKLTFNDTGIYTFTIEERIDNVGHVVYDTTVYQVTVDVKPGTGDSYKATVTYSVDGVSAQPVFRNAYASSLVLKKVDENSKILPGAEFSLVHNCVEDCKAEIETMVSVARDDGYLMFSAIPSGHDYILTETKVPTGYTKASDHIVKVVKGQVFVYEVGSDTPIVENIHEIVNYSKPTITISGVKTLSGKHLVDKAFSFSLMETDSNFQAIAGGHKETVKNAANGSFVFTAITYDKAGTYHYVVQENIGSEAGMTYDNTVYQVTVTVANNDKGKLIATVSYTRVAAEKEDVDYITFHNIFAPQEISVNIPGVKTLVGRELAAGEFSFQLVNADGKVIQTVTNAADGSFSFDKLTFTAAGTYTYTVHEVAGNLENVTYDTQVYTVTVTVTAGAHNALSADVVVTNENGTNAELRFVNDYEVPPTEPTVPSEPSEPTEPTVPSEPSEPTEPTVPSEPSEPTEPTVPSEPSKPNIPDTGDHSGIFGWSAMCFLSLAAIIVLLLTGGKKGGKYLKR